MVRGIYDMRLFSILAAVCCSCLAIAQSGQTASQPARPPLQLELRVPFDPTAFLSEGVFHLFYELHLTNFTSAALNVSGVEVLAAGAEPVAVFHSKQLDTMVQLLGGKVVPAPDGTLPIPGGRTAVVFVEITFDRAAHVPDGLIHRVITNEAVAEGASIATHHTSLLLFGPPLEGSNWLAADGPSNDADNHHRRGLFVIDGRAAISRRYAIDWKQVKDGASFSGDSRDVRSYYAFGKAVLAVADGRVTAARDGLPNNIPGHNEAFHPAVPITLDTVAGNTITIDLGGGQFAYYMHLDPGSVGVKVGDRVHRGQVIGRVGCSGDAREPHLHFEVTNSPKALAGEGVPYLIDRYRAARSSVGPSEVRVNELPLNNTIVTFGEERGK
jgi:hypothetical protein